MAKKDNMTVAFRMDRNQVQKARDICDRYSIPLSTALKMYVVSMINQDTIIVNMKEGNS